MLSLAGTHPVDRLLLERHHGGCREGPTWRTWLLLDLDEFASLSASIDLRLMSSTRASPTDRCKASRRIARSSTTASRSRLRSHAKVTALCAASGCLCSCSTASTRRCSAASTTSSVGDRNGRRDRGGDAASLRATHRAWPLASGAPRSAPPPRLVDPLRPDSSQSARAADWTPRGSSRV